MNQVMSFLPAVYRWDSLRLKYTDEFLAEGLKKKSVSRIKSVFNALYKEADSHVAFMKQHEEKTVGQFVKKHPSGYVHDKLKMLLVDAKISWYHSDKAKKIDAVVSLYKKLEETTEKWIVKKDIYDEACSKMTKILHALVIAVQPKKSTKKPRKTRKITDSAPPMPVFEPEDESEPNVPVVPTVPAVPSVPTTTDGLIEDSYTRIGIRINQEHTPAERVAEFVRKMGCEILATEVEAGLELIDKCRIIWEFAKSNS
jgi:hypothetical protein